MMLLFSFNIEYQTDIYIKEIGLVNRLTVNSPIFFVSLFFKIRLQDSNPVLVAFSEQM